MKLLHILLLLLFNLLSIKGYAQPSNDSIITKNLDVFSAVCRKVLNVYPNPIDGETFMLAAINPMLETVDPFTRFYNQTEAVEMAQGLNPKFGGIGIRMQDSPDGVIVISTFPNSPAEKAGIETADQITSIHGMSLKEMPFENVFSLLKGEAGSEVNVTIKRPQQPKEISHKIKRDIIKISAVSYSGMLDNDIAYIRLTGETRNSAEDVKNALATIYTKHKFNGLVFDLRGNEGGYLREAVKIANLFVNKGDHLTKIINKERDTVYYATEVAIYPATPMVVLIDKYTISAGEILAGAIQDNDRAVIMGQTTFGKGLVQEIFDMPGETKLKVTTGSYYTPSGRCIQAFNYDEGTNQIPDSLKSSFKTKNGRTVYNSGGISPDIETVYREPSNLVNSMLENNMFMDFAIEYRLRHPSIPAIDKFRINEADYNVFLELAKSKNTTYITETEHKLKGLKDSAIKEGTWSAIKDGFEIVENNLAREKEKEFSIYQTQIRDALEEAIVSMYYTDGGTQLALQKDPEVKKAMGILMDPVVYNKILNIKN